MKLIQLLIIFCYCTWCFAAGEEKEEEQALNKNPAPGQQPELEQGITGTTQETKNPDGSTSTVTHFKGQLPQGGFPGSHSHPAFPGWAFPGSPFFNPWAPQVSPAQIADKKHSKRDSKTNHEIKGQPKDSPVPTTQSLNVSSIPFSKRFPSPPRYSTKFHYPELPEVYWQHHKRPFVPLLDPELYGFNDVEGDIKQDL